MMRIYLDNCCYNRPYDDQSQVAISLEAQAKLHIQELIRKNEIELVSSYTRWRQNYFDSVNPEDYMNDSVAYDRSHPFTPKKKQIPIN